MEIECKLKRPDGTVVDMGTAKYHFAPRTDGSHVADVANDDHADRFLSIPEAYRLYRGVPASAPVESVQKEVAKPAAVEILLGSDAHPPSFDIHGKAYSLGDVVSQAQVASGLDVAEWNSLSGVTREDMIDEQLDKIRAVGAEPSQQPQPPVDEDALRAELVVKYEAKFGKKPHHNAGIDSIRAKLDEA